MQIRYLPTGCLGAGSSSGVLSSAYPTNAMEASCVCDTDQKQPRMRSVLEVMDRLQLSQTIDRHVGQHGLHLGLSNGRIAMLWLLCIICEGEQRKSAVKAWVRRHQAFLEQWLQQPLRPVEFSDSRLGILLHRLSAATAWMSLEEDLWRQDWGIRSRDLDGVCLSSVELPGAASGNGSAEPQAEPSQWQKQGKQQMRLSVATVEPSGKLMACDVHPATTDSTQRQMFLTRVQRLIEQPGLTYVLNAGMDTLPMRAQIVADGAHYVATPFSGECEARPEAAEILDETLRQAAQGNLPMLHLREQGRTVGVVTEREHCRAVRLGNLLVEWPERIQAVRSLDAAQREMAALARNVDEAEAALWALARKPSDGQCCFASERALAKAVHHIIQEHHVEGLLHVTWAKHEERRVGYVGRGRGGPNRPTREMVYTRYALTHVERNEEAIEQQRGRLGWQVRVTSLPAQVLPIGKAAERLDVLGLAGEPLEHKALPLAGLARMRLHRSDQVVGMMRLLLLAHRLRGMVRDGAAPATGPRRADSYPLAMREA